MGLRPHQREAVDAILRSLRARATHTSDHGDRIRQDPRRRPQRRRAPRRPCARPRALARPARPLTDQAWAVIKPLLAPSRMGRPVRDRRQVVNGILWKLATGAAGRDLPERYGPWKTVYERFRRWSADGTWDRLLAHVQQHSNAIRVVDLTIVCVDSTTVRAHQHAPGSKRGRDWPDEAIGRSRAFRPRTATGDRGDNPYPAGPLAEGIGPWRDEPVRSCLFRQAHPGFGRASA